jgi:hypothetical protein
MANHRGAAPPARRDLTMLRDRKKRRTLESVAGDVRKIEYAVLNICNESSFDVVIGRCIRPRFRALRNAKKTRRCADQNRLRPG